MKEYTCANCGASFTRRGSKVPKFCSVGCKSDWQRNQKPYTRDWLYEKYVVEGLGTYQIAEIVGRNPKQVWHWLKGYEIPLRTRDWDTTPDTKPYQDEAWLRNEYLGNRRSSGDIAREFGVTDANIMFYLHRFGILRRNISQARKVKKWGSSGSKNPMYGKRGAVSNNWRGGITPERQAFYATEEWKTAQWLVYRRDKATCQRCHKRKSRSDKFAIHHVVSFAIRELRAEPSNLILLCGDCHHWVHSKANVNRDFIKDAS